MYSLSPRKIGIKLPQDSIDIYSFVAINNKRNIYNVLNRNKSSYFRVKLKRIKFGL